MAAAHCVCLSTLRQHEARLGAFRSAFEIGKTCIDFFPRCQKLVPNLKVWTTPLLVRSSWNRQSKSANNSPQEKPLSKNRKTWRQRADKYLKPFQLTVHISAKNVTATVVHRVTSRAVAVASSNAAALRETFAMRPSNDEAACKLIGELIAERAKDADVYAVVFELKKGQKYEGQLAALVDAFIANGVTLV
eukprot:TRINITY_DN22087_c0_g1_i1.p1 TRINITY_DN22087_c0_g1~~TRINITY_DN22087_c0_g1_i1.p1  ORF type:complete len:191 (-),score=22.67 TRINITY_DN22087_c0_g1_i1:163-735(-)